MTATEAANVIGCSPQQVRTLIRTGRLPASKLPRLNGAGFVYHIRPRDARRYANEPQPQGWPRGKERK